ncbi:unnamed protein product [Protopolystoma xenopodis]|uniref:Uncharacterized protein n=1 Tax=Protopolystoma xenopodis TaxID=117903 RepID=A0A448XJL7_9PLAT|nr:unnamed protein product [Protopolystoma xenopodis]
MKARYGWLGAAGPWDETIFSQSNSQKVTTTLNVAVVRTSSKSSLALRGLEFNHLIHQDTKQHSTVPYTTREPPPNCAPSRPMGESVNTNSAPGRYLITPGLNGSVHRKMGVHSETFTGQANISFRMLTRVVGTAQSQVWLGFTNSLLSTPSALVRQTRTFACLCSSILPGTTLRRRPLCCMPPTTSSVYRRVAGFAF